MLREPESNLQAWNSNPKSSESRKWPNEDIEQSIDLRVDGIPNDETYKDEQYMWRIAEQVQKLMVTKDICKRRLTSGQHSQWEDCEENSWSRQLRVTWNSAKNEQSTMSTLLFIHWSWISSMSMRRKLDMSDEMLSCIRQKFKQLIADAYMTFQGSRVARHGVQPWQKHHYIAKEFMRKIHKKGIFSLILDRFQNDDVFHASQLQHKWTTEWCEYLDYVKTIDSTHKTSPEQIGTIRSVVSFSVRSETNGERPNRKAPRGPSNNTEDLDSEKLDWLLWLSHNWKWYFAVNQISELKSTQWHHLTSATCSTR